MKVSMYHRFAVWLVPRAEDQQWLSAIISALANQYDAPIFEPHVTVYGGVYTPTDSLATLLPQVAPIAPPLTLTIQTIDQTADLFKTLFLVLAPHPALTLCSQRIQHQLQHPDNYLLQPHVSLIYKPLSARQKQTIIADLTLPSSSITFDTLKVVAPRSGSWRDFDTWHVLDSQPLGHGDRDRASAINRQSQTASPKLHFD